MKKKMLFVIATIVAFTLFVPSVMAATIDVNGTTVKLSDAVSAAAEKDTLKLTADITVDSEITINKELTIDLNNHKITIDDSKSKDCIKVVNGKLTVTGTGTIEEKVPYYGAIWVYGSTNKADTDYSVLVVDENVTLKGYSGVLVRQTDGNKAYGVDVTVKGTIIAVTDGKETGTGIQVSGNIKPKKGETADFTNYPVINIEGASITSDGVGIYAAGYATWNIKNANITGIESSIGIKSGILNIESGTFKSTGKDSRPTQSYNNGINASGAAIQIESNSGYAGNIEINITGGTFISEQGVAVYEYLALGEENTKEDDTTATTIKNIAIKGGSFESVVSDFDVSESFDKKHSEFVSGGTFSDGSLPDGYLATDKEYVVTADGEVLLEENTVIFKMYRVVDGKIQTDEDGKEIYSEAIIKKGYEFSKEEIAEFEEMLKELEEDVEKEYKEEGFVLLGVFTDKDGKNKVDLTKSIDTDTSWYLVVGEKVEELPPKTSDINLVVLIGTILVGIAGAVIVSKKRFAKSN